MASDDPLPASPSEAEKPPLAEPEISEAKSLVGRADVLILQGGSGFVGDDGGTNPAGDGGGDDP